MPTAAPTENESRRCIVDKRWESLKNERRPMEPLWRELRDAFMPARGLFDGEGDTASAPNRNTLVNSTPLFAADTLASGLHAGLTSPARQWQRTAVLNDDIADFGPVKNWLATTDARMMQWFGKSGLYEALPFAYGEFGVFGTMVILSFESDVTLFRYEALTIGEYWLGRDAHGEYDTCYRRQRYTVRQLVAEFGEANVSDRVRTAYANPSRREDRIEVLHVIEPCPDKPGTWDSLYWEVASKDGPREGLLKAGKFSENPIHAASWETIGNNAYACNCPGMKARGDAKSLQVDEKDLARAKQRHHNPPMQGPSALKRQGVSLVPGAMNWVDHQQAAGQNGGIRPVHDFTPQIDALAADIQRKEARINMAFFRDLFLMLTLDQRKQRATAEEIRDLYDEKVLALGPTLERSNKMLRGMHARHFGIMVRRSMPFWTGVLDGDPPLPPPPQELHDAEIVPEFISALMQAQRATSLQGLERLSGFAIQFSQFTKALPEKLDVDQVIDQYAAGLGVPPDVVRSDAAVQAMREAQAQRAQMEQMAQLAPAIKQGAEAMRTMQETPTDQGDNLLSAVGSGLGPMAMPA